MEHTDLGTFAGRSIQMNIRRGFNRLSMALYGVWFLVLVVGGLTEAYSLRDSYSRRLQEHEEISPDQRRADLLALQMGLAEKMSDWTDEERQRFVAAVDRVVSGQSRPDEDDWFERVVRPNFSYTYPSFLPSKYLTPTEVAAYRNWRDYPVLTFLTDAFSRKSNWAGWILLFGIPGGLYLSVLALAYGSRWVYRGFAYPNHTALESHRSQVSAPAISNELTEPAPIGPRVQPKGTMSKRILWLAVVTVLWTLVAALLASNFAWARGSTAGTAWWLWLMLAILWRLVIEFVPVPKKEKLAEKSGNGERA